MPPEMWERVRAVTGEHDDVQLEPFERIRFWALVHTFSDQP